MNNEDKIVKALEQQGKAIEDLRQGQKALQTDITYVKQAQANTATKQDIGQLHTTLGQHETILDALKAGQEDIREGNNRIEHKIDRLAQDARKDRERIENLEQATNTHNPHKN